MKKKPDFIQLWNPVISFCRIYAVIPLRQSDKEPYFERCSGSLCWCLLVASIYLFGFVLSVILVLDTFSSSSKIIANATFYLIYYVHCEMTLNWIQVENLLIKHKIHLGKVLVAQCWTIVIATLIMSHLENGCYIISAVIDAESLSDTIHLFVNLAGKGTDLNPYFGDYKDIYGFFLIFVESLSEVAWISGDLIIALISIICRRYYEALQEKLLSDNHHSFRQLEELRKLQLAISTLVHKVAEVFSPLILISVGCNVVYILAFLYSGLEADLFSPSFLVRLIFTYSFIYVVLRLIFSVFLASRLSEMPEKTIDYLYSLPSIVGSNSDEQMIMIVQEIQSNPVSLGGSGFFVLCKSSAAALFSLIVTYEVVMLQLPR
ncbi:gustatory receptor for sugar taste 64b-like [Daphnia pulex]|uniref:gustatory receptor for sugar taste 64b-like n=1 Tax=Daphnia pulex TaxID=6669 RepID=UPI001EE02410|nr:gustatory receptor for sugar taste 64b-like [Daphnia pulex]